MKLANRVYVDFLVVILAATLASTTTGALLLTKALREEALARVQLNLKGARTRLDSELELLAVSAQVESQGLSGRLQVPHHAQFTLLYPDSLPSSLARLGLRAEGTQRGFLLLTERQFLELGPTAADIRDLPLGAGGELLTMFAAHRGPAGTALTLAILNGNWQLVRQLQENLFSTALYKGKPFGTVTIFCRDTRVATTVLGPGGVVAVGTKVSPEVRERVLVQGKTWLDRALVVDELYLSAYEPIADPLGERVGILYVGVLEQKYKDIRLRTIFLMTGLIVPIMGLAMFLSFVMTRGIVRPLSLLSEASGRIGSGTLDQPLGRLKGSSEIQRLAAAFSSMQAAIRDRENRLRSQNQELEEANRDYQELLSFVTHELNNSVGSLLLNVSLLEEESGGRVSQEQQELIEQVLRDVERFRDMVKNYLNLSRLEKGTLRFNPSRLDVRSRVIEPALERLSRWIRHRRFEIRWDWPEKVEIVADADLLDICYSNFVVNALKYGRDWIRFSARSSGTTCELAVANGGSPIPPAKIPLLFRKFSRLVRSSDGAGLGLYLVRRIVERHGGEVGCESSAEQGTVFKMRLPAGGPASTS